MGVPQAIFNRCNLWHLVTRIFSGKVPKNSLMEWVTLTKRTRYHYCSRRLRSRVEIHGAVDSAIEFPQTFKRICALGCHHRTILNGNNYRLQEMRRQSLSTRYVTPHAVELGYSHVNLGMAAISGAISRTASPIAGTIVCRFSYSQPGGNDQTHCTGMILATLVSCTVYAIKTDKKMTTLLA